MGWYLITQPLNGSWGSRISFYVDCVSVNDNEILLSPNTTAWTNEDVLVSAMFGISVNPTTLTCTGEEGTDYTIHDLSVVTVKTNNQTVTATGTDAEGNTINTSLTISNIDKVAPTAPTITGGNTSETYAGTDVTISVDKAATDEGSGVKNYQYYESTSGTEPTNSTSGYNLNSDVTSKYFWSNREGTYVYFRAVDNAGNVGEWSNVQRVWLDTLSPSVTANERSVTISPGDSYELSEFFTVTANGNAPIESIVYTINGEEYTNTSSILAGTYEIKCTAVKINGLSNNASMTLVVKRNNSRTSSSSTKYILWKRNNRIYLYKQCWYK